MRESANIRAVDALGVDWMGFIFYPASPRYAGEPDPEVLASVRAEKVGVFVGGRPAEVLRLAERYGLKTLQLHGDEPPETCRKYRDRGFRAVKAVRVRGGDDLERAVAYADACDYLLFDTGGGGYGGTGVAFDWELLSRYTGSAPFFLSGGIRPGDAGRIRSLRHPRLAGVDLNSRFEAAPGLKDIALLTGFLNTLRYEQSDRIIEPQE